MPQNSRCHTSRSERMKSRWALFSILYSLSRKLKVRKGFQCQICDSSKNWANLCQGTRRISAHMWYVNGAWLIISSAQFVLEHLYLIFHPIFPVRWKLSPLHERCCDILFKCAIVIWTTLTVRCRPFEHNKVHHPCCCYCMVLQVKGKEGGGANIYCTV